MALQSSTQVLRPKIAAERLGVCRATLYNLAKRPGFPAPVRMGPRAVGFLAHELDAWLESCRAQGGVH